MHLLQCLRQITVCLWRTVPLTSGTRMFPSDPGQDGAFVQPYSPKLALKTHELIQDTLGRHGVAMTTQMNIWAATTPLCRFKHTAGKLKVSLLLPEHRPGSCSSKVAVLPFIG